MLPQSQLVSPNPLPTPSPFILVSCFSFALCCSWSVRSGPPWVAPGFSAGWAVCALLPSLTELCAGGGYGRAHTGDTASTVRRRLSMSHEPWCRHASSAVAPACAVRRNVLLFRHPQVSPREGLTHLRGPQQRMGTPVSLRPADTVWVCVFTFASLEGERWSQHCCWCCGFVDPLTPSLSL